SRAWTGACSSARSSTTCVVLLIASHGSSLLTTRDTFRGCRSPSTPTGDALCSRSSSNHRLLGQKPTLADCGGSTKASLHDSSSCSRFKVGRSQGQTPNDILSQFWTNCGTGTSTALYTSSAVASPLSMSARARTPCIQELRNCRRN